MWSLFFFSHFPEVIQVMTPTPSHFVFLFVCFFKEILHVKTKTDSFCLTLSSSSPPRMTSSPSCAHVLSRWPSISLCVRCSQWSTPSMTTSSSPRRFIFRSPTCTWPCWLSGQSTTLFGHLVRLIWLGRVHISSYFLIERYFFFLK